MKKGIITILILVLAFVVFGCASSPKGEAVMNSSTMPPWISDFPPEDVLYGIGFSDSDQMTPRMTQAESRARMDIARQLNTLAQGMIIDYSREAGAGNDTVTLQFFESVSRQITNANISGASPDQRWPTPDGKGFWVRVKMSKADAARTIQSAIDSESSQYAEFKAMQALDMLDYQLQNNPQRPNQSGLGQ